MKPDKGRLTKGVFIRISVQEYEWLEGKSNGTGVASYIRNMISKAYANRISVPQSDIRSSSPVLLDKDGRRYKLIGGRRFYP